MPLFMVGVLVYTVFRGVRWPAVWVMQQWRISKYGETRVVEIRSEESKSLVEHIEKVEEKDEDGGLRSSAHSSPKTSSDGREKGEKIV